MSIYSDCSQAIADLSELHEVFTEIDVVNHAASDGWSKPNFKEARKYANQIVSAKFRSGELVRYGPVEYDGVKDYARRASMIVYGGAERGPATWDTPNGKFPQLARHEDNIQSSGRKRGTARHDEMPWAEQDTVPKDIRIIGKVSGSAKSTKKGSSNSDSAGKEIARLNEALAAANAEVEQLKARLDTKGVVKMPTQAAPNGTTPGLTRAEVEDIIANVTADLETRVDDRVRSLEDRLAGLVQFAGGS